MTHAGRLADLAQRIQQEGARFAGAVLGTGSAADVHLRRCAHRSMVSDHSTGHSLHTLSVVEGTNLLLITGIEAGMAATSLIPARLCRLAGIPWLFALGEGQPVDARSEPAAYFLSDHVNLSGRNPLVGPNDEEWGPRFPDVSHAYEPGVVAFAAGSGFPGGIWAEMSDLSGGHLDLARRMGAVLAGVGVAGPAIGAAHAGVPFAAAVSSGSILSDPQMTAHLIGVASAGFAAAKQRPIDGN